MTPKRGGERREVKELRENERKGKKRRWKHYAERSIESGRGEQKKKKILRPKEKTCLGRKERVAGPGWEGGGV